MTYRPVSSITSNDNHYSNETTGFEYCESEGMDDRSLMEGNISKLSSAVHSVKQDLNFSTEDIIEENTLNVGPQHNLEKELPKQIEAIQKTVPQAKTVNDSIPESVLKKLSEVNRIAKDGNSSTFTASGSLETTMPAFSYGRTAALDRFDLKKEGSEILAEYDETFVGTIQSQLEYDIDGAEQKMAHCFKLLDQARRESHTDQTLLTQRQAREGEQVDLMALDVIHSTAKDELLGEENEFLEIQRTCEKDIAIIDGNLEELLSVLNSTTDIYQSRERERSEKLERNLEEQEELQNRLEQLKAEENEYMRVDKEEEEMIKRAKDEYNMSEGDLKEWRDKISTLREQATASLRILEVMKTCTDDILTDAKTKKKDWEDTLKDMEYKSLINTRDVLVAGICLHRMKTEDCSGNIEETEKDIERKKIELADATRRMFREKVEECKFDIDKKKETISSYTEQLSDHNSKIEEMSNELASVNGRIRDIKPDGLSLPSVDHIYRERKRIKEDCFKRESTDEAKKKLHSTTVL